MLRWTGEVRGRVRVAVCRTERLGTSTGMVRVRGMGKVGGRGMAGWVVWKM